MIETARKFDQSVAKKPPALSEWSIRTATCMTRVADLLIVARARSNQLAGSYFNPFAK